VSSTAEGAVHVGLGGNLGDPERTFVSAVEELQRLDDVSVLRCSSLYASAPLGPSQPEFRNAVIAVRTGRTPESLLALLLEVERAHGRVRGERWGPRVLDLDILLWGDRIVDVPGLRIPHPELSHRRFALEPLAELAPDALVPSRGRVAELLAELESSR